MTIWTIKKNKNNVSVSRKFEKQKSVLLCNKQPSIHKALSEISTHLESGDVVLTPEGPCIVQGLSGCGNN